MRTFLDMVLSIVALGLMISAFSFPALNADELEKNVTFSQAYAATNKEVTP